MAKNSQQSFYEPVKAWLQDQGFECLITDGKRRQLVIPVTDLVPLRSYAVPDVVGVRGDGQDRQVVVVEVETKTDTFFSLLGKWMMWKVVATFVYAAFPVEEAVKFKLLERLGIGLLDVSGGRIKEVVEILSAWPSHSHKILELHPLDPPREIQLAQEISRITGGSS
jgi:hypothetical protein